MAHKPLWKIIAYKEALIEIIELEDDGFNIERLTDWHWKYKNINIYPSSKKIVKNGKVSNYNKIRDIL